MHTKHNTESVILGGKNSEEASKILFLFTKEFGLVNAHVRGVREISSKLRYSLQDFSYIYTDLVRGKAGWRITSAVHIKSFYNFGREDKKHTLCVVARVSNLLKRLLTGEEKNKILFEDIVRGFTYLSEECIDEEDSLAIEVVLVMRILNYLGYWGDDSTLSPFLYGDVANVKYIKNIKKQKSHAIVAINKALQETQL